MTNPKVHIHLQVSDLAKSREFYQRFFGVSPVKEKPGYAKFLAELGPVNLALSEGRTAARVRGAVDHLGIQVESPAIVMREMARLKAGGLPVREEIGVTCCHANQDKFWVEDPDGVEWEVYHLNYDVEEETTGPAGLPRAKVASCCGSAT